MKCLVTGGAGFIGSNLLKVLCEKKMDVTVLDNFSTGYEFNLQPFVDVKVIQGDIRSKEVVDSLVAKNEVIFHLAASVGNKKSIESPYFDTENNAVGVLNVLEAMKKYGNKTIVFSSSAGIFGEPQYQPVDEVHPCSPDSPYGVSKLYGEKMCLTYMKLYPSLRAVCLRYFNVYGVNQRFDAYGNVIPIFCHQILKNQPITIFGHGEQTRDFINGADIARANFSAAINKEVRGVVNIGTGQAITIKALAQQLFMIAGRDTPLQYALPRAGDVLHCTSKNEKMKKELGIDSTLPLSTGLSEYFHWMEKDHIFLNQ